MREQNSRNRYHDSCSQYDVFFQLRSGFIYPRLRCARRQSSHSFFHVAAATGVWGAGVWVSVRVAFCSGWQTRCHALDGKKFSLVLVMVAVAVILWQLRFRLRVRSGSVSITYAGFASIIFRNL